ncbi:Uncharacterised protein [uncultured archaeon]|jgi:hypothetical protein|nr:Uncharacterised protein [uncultured archaeon]
MRVGDEIEDITDRELVVKPAYKKIDKHGRLYIDVGLANKEVLMILVEPIPNDKIKFLKVGRSS